MRVYTLQEIEKAIDIPHLIGEIEKGLVLYSEKKTQVSPVGFLKFAGGDVHIKSGCINGEGDYVVKIASGFYDNPKRGLPSSDGLMLLFSQETGQLKAILLDEGRLTDLRTGIAGAICAKYLSPKRVDKIGIIGTGIQAREQLKALQYVSECRTVLVYGRDPAKALAFASDPLLSAFNISPVKTIDELAEACQLIVTTTPSSKPLLFAHQIRPGTHITAVGADHKGKQEVDASVFEMADLIVVDSFLQCSEYGDYSYAKQCPCLELGELIKHPRARAEGAITIADLTGVAVEDLQIAGGVYASMLRT